MDLQLASLPLLLATVPFILLIIRALVTKRSGRLNLPPGPPQLPFIGNLHQVATYPLIHRRLRDLAAKYGPIMSLKLGEVPVVVISSPEFASVVMKAQDIAFANRPSILASKIISYDATGIVFTPYGDYWRQVRKICTIELLSHARVQSFAPIREQEVGLFVQGIYAHAGQKINLSEKIFTLTAGITGRAAFGEKTKAQEEYMSSLVPQLVPLLTGLNAGDFFPSSRLVQAITNTKRRLERVHEKQDNFYQNIIDEHRKKADARKTAGEETGDEDLVDVLLRIQKSGDLQFPLTDDNIKAIITDVFNAGSESSSTTVEWAMSELVRNPEAMERAQAEVREAFGKAENLDEATLPKLKYLQAVIKETLRLHPSGVLLLPRENQKDCEINGYVIPAKTRVVINAWGIGRTSWSNGDSFDPDRFLEGDVDYKGKDFEFIPFGAGRRICPGITFAVANIQLPLARMLFHFDWKLSDGLKPHEVDMTEAFGLAVRRKNDLHLIPVPYVYP